MASDLTRVGVDLTPEAAAVQALYERHAGRVYSFCLHQLGTREEAEDATQSTFLNAFRGLKRGVAPVAEAPWLLTIAQNVCLTRLRSSVRRRRVEAPRDLQALQDKMPAPVREGVDELIRLEDALTELPASQRRAILLREWQGLSYREIGEELDTSQAAVETLIFRARRTLAARLEAPRRTLARRVARWIDLGSAAAWLQAVLAGGTAKAVATAAAVTTAAAVGSAPLRHDAPPPAEATPPRPATAAPAAPAAPAAAAPAVPETAVRVVAPASTKTRRLPVTRKLAPVRRAPRPRRPALAPVAEPREKPAAARNDDRAEAKDDDRGERAERKADERRAERGDEDSRGQGRRGGDDGREKEEKRDREDRGSLTAS